MLLLSELLIECKLEGHIVIQHLSKERRNFPLYNNEDPSIKMKNQSWICPFIVIMFSMYLAKT